MGVARSHNLELFSARLGRIWDTFLHTLWDGGGVILCLVGIALLKDPSRPDIVGMGLLKDCCRSDSGVARSGPRAAWSRATGPRITFFAFARSPKEPGQFHLLFRF